MNIPSAVSPPETTQSNDAGLSCAAELHASEFEEFDEIRTNVTLVEADGLNDALHTQAFQDAQLLAAHCSASKPALRIISIPQEDSYEPLQITKACMEGIIREHNISADFLNVLMAAGEPPRESESGFGYPLENAIADDVYSMSYLFRYPEKRGTSWHLRQTGMYHQYSKAQNSNFFLVLHPREDSVFQKQLDVLVRRTRTHDGDVVKCPMIVHRMLFESYIGNWRLFLGEQGKAFIKSADKLFALDYQEDHYRDISFRKLQWWRDLEDQIIPCSAILEATLVSLDVFDRAESMIQYAKRTDDPSGAGFSYFMSRKALVEALRLSASSLQQRIHGALSMLENTLELRSANELEKVNRNLFNLQKENVEDNETVKVITILTLIYLPGSFVATLLGTNLFFFNPQTSKVRIADNSWWYAVLFVPLMAVTIASWQLARRSSKKRREVKTKAWQALQNAVAPDGSIELQKLQSYFQGVSHQQA